MWSTEVPGILTAFGETKEWTNPCRYSSLGNGREKFGQHTSAFPLTPWTVRIKGKQKWAGSGTPKVCKYTHRGRGGVLHQDHLSQSRNSRWSVLDKQIPSLPLSFLAGQETWSSSSPTPQSFSSHYILFLPLVVLSSSLFHPPQCSAPSPVLFFHPNYCSITKSALSSKQSQSTKIKL